MILFFFFHSCIGRRGCATIAFLDYGIDWVERRSAVSRFKFYTLCSIFFVLIDFHSFENHHFLFKSNDNLRRVCCGLVCGTPRRWLWHKWEKEVWSQFVFRFNFLFFHVSFTNNLRISLCGKSKICTASEYMLCSRSAGWSVAIIYWLVLLIRTLHVYTMCVLI